jgi:hypothetical protein
MDILSPHLADEKTGHGELGGVSLDLPASLEIFVHDSHDYSVPVPYCYSTTAELTKG